MSYLKISLLALGLALGVGLLLPGSVGTVSAFDELYDSPDGDSGSDNCQSEKTWYMNWTRMRRCKVTRYVCNKGTKDQYTYNKIESCTYGIL